jgi:hypothetical protein
MPVGVAGRAVCCESRRRLAEQFSIAARLYAESVALLTRSGQILPEEYDRLRKGAEEAQRRAEAIGLAFEEHVDSPWCGKQST